MQFSEYIESKSSKSFFLFPTNKNKFSNIISNLNPNKSVGPNSTLAKILK